MEQKPFGVRSPQNPPFKAIHGPGDRGGGTVHIESVLGAEGVTRKEVLRVGESQSWAEVPHRIGFKFVGRQAL